MPLKWKRNFPESSIKLSKDPTSFVTDKQTNSTSLSHKLIRSGLPDGVFAYQKSQCGYFSKALEWKTLVHFTATWYIL
jgi:hypothetical protein